MFSCFPALQLCEPKLKQLMGVPKRVLFQDNQTNSVDETSILISTKQCYKFDLATFLCKWQDATNSTLYIQASFVNKIQLQLVVFSFHMTVES